MNNDNIDQDNQVQMFENIINWDMVNNTNWGDVENSIPISPIINSGPKYTLMKNFSKEFDNKRFLS